MNAIQTSSPFLYKKNTTLLITLDDDRVIVHHNESTVNAEMKSRKERKVPQNVRSEVVK